jgi:hypothetical protein
MDDTEKLVWIAEIVFALWGGYLGKSGYLGKRVSLGIFIGMLLGFFMSWFGIFVIYCWNRWDQEITELSPAKKLLKYKKLLDKGAITAGDYNKKKMELLSLDQI